MLFGIVDRVRKAELEVEKLRKENDLLREELRAFRAARAEKIKIEQARYAYHRGDKVIVAPGGIDPTLSLKGVIYGFEGGSFAVVTVGEHNYPVHVMYLEKSQERNPL